MFENTFKNDVFNAVKVLGNGEVSKVRNIFLTFQKNLYLPHEVYSSVAGSL